jgi:hypothetical protein
VTRERLDAPLLKAFEGLQEGSGWWIPAIEPFCFQCGIAALVGLDPGNWWASRCFGFASTPQDQCFWADGAEVLAQGSQCQTQLQRNVTVRWCRWSSGWWHARRICMTRHCLSP